MDKVVAIYQQTQGKHSMIFFRRLALHRFVRAHPPGPDVKPAPSQLIKAYEGILPASLLELWRKKGLGFYGELQIALIDPRPWQPVLDSWITNASDNTQRIPIALTPFGTLLYYRKLTDHDEDVASIDPVTKQSNVLAWSLDDFFNEFLYREDAFETLIPTDSVLLATQECGQLEDGEVYEVDQALLQMQMLKSRKTNALDMHRRLRDAVDAPQATAEQPTSVLSALPTEYRAIYQSIANNTTSGPGLTGLYLSSYLDWHRLLALQSNGQYSLLFWCLNYQTFECTEIRTYQGRYKIRRNAHGEDTIQLNIELDANSLGSDARDEQLIAMHSGSGTFLLREDELENMASDISDHNVMGRSECYFRRVALTDAYQDEPYDGRAAPPLADLPYALRALVNAEPDTL